MTPERKERVVAGTIRDQLDRARWSPAAVQALMGTYTDSAATLAAHGDVDADMYRAGAAMLHIVRDAGLDQQAFYERFIEGREAA